MSEYYAVVREGDSLKHYGVLGMRWGIRRDRRVKAAKAMYKTNRKAIKKDKSLSKTQKQKKIAASREEWMKERENAANRLYSKNSTAMNSRIARMSSKKALAQSYLMGSYGAKEYNRMRANGHGRYMSYRHGNLANSVNMITLGGANARDTIRNRKARKKR